MISCVCCRNSASIGADKSIISLTSLRTSVYLLLTVRRSIDILGFDGICCDSWLLDIGEELTSMWSAIIPNKCILTETAPLEPSTFNNTWVCVNPKIIEESEIGVTGECVRRANQTNPDEIWHVVEVWNLWIWSILVLGTAVGRRVLVRPRVTVACSLWTTVVRLQLPYFLLPLWLVILAHASWPLVCTAHVALHGRILNYQALQLGFFAEMYEKTSNL